MVSEGPLIFKVIGQPSDDNLQPMDDQGFQTSLSKENLIYNGEFGP